MSLFLIKYYSFTLKLSIISKYPLQNISMDTLGTGRGSIGSREEHFGNRCANQLSACRINQ